MTTSLSISENCGYVLIYWTGRKGGVMDVMDVWSSQEKERGSLEKGNPQAQPHISHRLSFLACRIGARDLGNDTALCSQRS